MKMPKRKIDRVSIEWANSRAKQHIESMRKRLSEYDSNPSGKDGYCGYCSYINSDRIGGSAITNIECSLCSTTMTFANTCTDTLCKECAAENVICRKCGADIELKNRRKQRPFQEDRQQAGGESHDT